MDSVTIPGRTEIARRDDANAMELRWKVPNISCNDKISSGFERALHHPIVIWIPRYHYFFPRDNEIRQLSKVSNESRCPALIQSQVLSGQNLVVFIERDSEILTAKSFSRVAASRMAAGAPF